MKSFKFLIYILLCSTIIAQEPFTTKEWQEVNCDGIDAITCDNMWGVQDNSNCYIFLNDVSILYKFTPDKQNATLEEYYNIGKATPKLKPFIQGNYAYCVVDDKDMAKEILGIAVIDLSGQESLKGYLAQDILGSGSFFIIDNVQYLLTNLESGRLFQIKLIDAMIDTEIIDIKHIYTLEFTPSKDTSVITLNNTIYYFSNSGLCSAKISGDKVVNELISSVSVTDASSKLVTDNNSRIWIINSTDGVVEYNTKKGTATNIATLPTSRLSNREADFTKACFYSDNYLYLITAGKAYSLDTTQQDDPDNPQRPHDQSGHRLLECGCLGIEFVLVLISVFVLKRKH
jgi:hypothetical protein